MLFSVLLASLLASKSVLSLGTRHGTKALHRRHSAPAATHRTSAARSSDRLATSTASKSGSGAIPDPAHRDPHSRREELVLFSPEHDPAVAKLQAVNPVAAPTPAPAAVPTVPSQTLAPLVVGPPPPTQPPVKGPPPPAAAAAPRRPILGAYYTGWDADEFPPEQVDFSKYDWIDFAFGVPDGNAGVEFANKSEADILTRLVKSAHDHQRRVKLSIGGWGDSKDFSPMVSTEDKRRAFASGVADIYKKFNLDGVDLDWEYPGERGDSANKYSPQDTENFLAFLTKLRAALPPSATITAACQDWPFAGADGKPVKDVSGFNKVLDWILLMNYDIFSGSSAPGPNAPLANACGNSSQPGANAISAVKAWTDAGFPASKLVLGLPSYGYVYHSLASPSGTDKHKRKDNESDADDILVLKAVKEDNDMIRFFDLVHQGALQKDQRGKFVGSNGFQRNWDGCSGTPYLRSVSAHQVVTYDDPDSLGLKAEFARKAGLMGVSIFDAHGDTADGQLLDGIRRGLGIIKS